MKPFLSLLFVAFISISISSCSKKTEFLTDPNISSPSFKAKVDGTLVECPVANALVYDLSGKKTMQIAGSKGNEGFTLLIDDYKGVGNYDMSDENFGVYIGNAQDAGNTSYFSISGIIKITTVTDKTIKGTFDFKALSLSTSAEKTITAGEFAINLK